MSKLQLFIFISEKSVNAADWNWSLKCLSSNRKQPSACLLTPTRTPEDCPDILHDFQTLTRCNLRVTQLLLAAHALVNCKGLSDCYLWCLFWLILVKGQSLDVKGHRPFFATHHFSVIWCLSSFELTSCLFVCFLGARTSKIHLYQGLRGTVWEVASGQLDHCSWNFCRYCTFTGGCLFVNYFLANIIARSPWLK